MNNRKSAAHKEGTAARGPDWDKPRLLVPYAYPRAPRALRACIAHTTHAASATHPDEQPRATCGYAHREAC